MLDRYKKTIRLVLADGTQWPGFSFGAEVSVTGEVVFNTAMTGYPESLTDPSYAGQLLVLTYPLIGNYGVPPDLEEGGMLRYFESAGIRIAGLVVAGYSPGYSHWNARLSLGQWLQQQRVPGIYGIDTRALTQHLRAHGAMPGKIVYEDQDLPICDPNQSNLAAAVSVARPVVYGDGPLRIVLVDCGVKNSIIRCLVQKGATVLRVPWNYDYSREEYDGIVVSNGPGDPRLCIETIAFLQQAFLGERPIFGICLGNQLMALAAGATVYKLKYGHRGHNQPVLRQGTARAYITAQNHGFAVDNRSLPPGWEPLFTNLNDHTNEGLRHGQKPFFSTQFHPEASGGPADTMFLFDEFLQSVRQVKDRRGR